MTSSDARQDRPELQKAIEEIVDSGFTGVQLRVDDRHGTWVGRAGVAALGQSAKPPAGDHLPEFGLDGRVTVRMPLQHTSGLFNFTGEYYEDGTFAPDGWRRPSRPGSNRAPTGATPTPTTSCSGCRSRRSPAARSPGRRSGGS